MGRSISSRLPSPLPAPPRHPTWEGGSPAPITFPRLFRSVSFQAGLRAQLASIFDSNTLKQYPGPGVESRFNVLPRILSRVRKRLTTSRRGEFRPRGGSLRTTAAEKGDADERSTFSFNDRKVLFSSSSLAPPTAFLISCLEPWVWVRGLPSGTRAVAAALQGMAHGGGRTLRCDLSADNVEDYAVGD